MEAQELSKVIEQSTIDPDWFCQHVLRMPNEPWQSELMNAVADLDRVSRGIPTQFNHDSKRKFSIRSGHGPGKTHAVAKLMHWYNFTRRARIPCVGPKEKSIKERVWPEFRKIRAAAIREYSKLITVKATKIEWAGDMDWCALIESAATPENMAGYHDDDLLFIVEEASGVPEEMWPVIYGALSTLGAILLVVGNPTRVTGEFYRIHNKAEVKREFYLKHVLPHESKFVDNAWVDQMVLQYGRQSPVVKVRVFGEFATMGANQLIALEWLEEARERDKLEDGSFPRLRVAVDVADGGEDETVITVARLYDNFTWVEKMTSHNFPPARSPIMAAQAAERIYREAGGVPANGDDLVVDSIGVGAGTAGYLLEQKLPVVIYKGGETSDDPKQWRNRRVQSYITLRNELRDGQIGFAPGFVDSWDDFCAQACSVETRLGVERVEDLETKADLRRRGVKSPDMSDSVSMIFAGKQPHLSRQQNVEVFVARSMVAHGPGVR